MTNEFISPKSETVTIKNLLTYINNGEWKLLLPSFQRSFVWSDDDIKRFFESIINGYPTGSILLWQPSDEKIDPFNRELIDGSYVGSPSETYYILDGQQRLTALMLLAKGWKIRRNNKEISCTPLSYNTSKSSRALYKGEGRGVDLYRGIKDRLYVDLDESSKLKEELEKDSYNRFIEVIEKILDYEMPIYVVKTRNETVEILEKMANIFIMVNRAGQRISNVELLLSYAAGVFDQEITNNIKLFYDEIQAKYGEEIDIQPFLRFAFSKAVIGLRQQDIENVERFKVSVEKLSSQIKINGKKLLHEKVYKAFESFTLALDLIRELFGSAATNLIPSHLSLVPVACYLHVNDITDLSTLHESNKTSIKKWLILVNFNGYYSTRPSSRLQKDIETVCVKGVFPFEELVENIRKNRPLSTYISKDSILDGYNKDILKRPNVAYLFLLYTALVDNNADDFTGKLIKNAGYDELARHHIFPRTLLREQYKIPEEVSEEDYSIKGVSGLGNITFVNKKINNEIYNEDPSNYLTKYSIETLKRHFIPDKNDFWDVKRFEEFAEARIDQLYKFLKNVYPEIVGEQDKHVAK
ncbi:MAG: GmrSD restriction endonuclease domain-containing protein [Thermoproteota archaeon]